MDRLTSQFDAAIDQVKREYAAGSFSLPTLAAFGALLLAFIPVFNALRGAKRQYPLPPGPRGLPYFGNAFQMPSARPWFWFQKLGKEYGPLVYLNMSGKPMVIITGEAEAKQLLESKGSTTSSRPPMIVAHKYMSNEKRILFLPYGDAWRTQRQAVHKYTMPKSAQSYAPLQMIEVKKTVYDMLEDPAEFDFHCKRYTASVALKFTYGLRAATGKESKLREMDRIAETFLTSIGFGPFLVEVVPILDYLPDFLSPWRVMSKKLWKDTIKLYGGLANDVKKRMEDGTADPNCLCAEMWEAQKANGLDDDDIAMLAGGMFEAGTDTTANEIRAFIMAAVKNPAVVKKAQQEIEDVLDGEIPTIYDIEKLPYVRAIVKEVLRWRTVAPNGTVHMTTADEVVNGYLIPKGTSLIFNIWAVHFDESQWEDPEAFIPERFMAPKDNADLTNGHNAFGRGRRICPGLHIASRSMYLVISRLLWTFDFAPAVDASGKEILIDDSETDLSGVVKRFKCKITPRSAEHAQRARQEWEDVADMAGPSLD